MNKVYCYRWTQPDQTGFIQRVSRLPNAHVLITGDFNLPGWDWNTMTLKPRSSSPRLQHDFLSMVYDNGLEQLVKEPTMEENTLDLFLTNCPQLEVVLGISDHSIPYCEISTSARRKKQTQRQIPLYNKTDSDSLRTVAIERSADLQRMDGVATTEELWTTFRDSLLAVVKFIPHKTARPKPCQPWVTPSIRKLINRRDRTYRKMKKTGSEDLRTEVKNLRRTVQRQLRRSYWNYPNTVFTGEDTPDQAGKNKRFWSYIKHQKPSDTGVAPLKKDGHLTSDHKAQAELLNGQFQSVKQTVSVSLRRWQTVHSRRVWAEDWSGWQRHTRNWWYQDIRAKSEDA